MFDEIYRNYLKSKYIVVRSTASMEKLSCEDFMKLNKVFEEMRQLEMALESMYNFEWEETSYTIQIRNIIKSFRIDNGLYAKNNAYKEVSPLTEENFRGLVFAMEDLFLNYVEDSRSFDRAQQIFRKFRNIIEK